jgi:integrase
MAKTNVQPISKLLTSSAQNVTLCARPESGLTKPERILAHILALPNVGSVYGSLIELQFTHALRISEVLNLSGADLLPLNHIKIASLKGSIPRIITFRDRYGYLENCRSSGADPYSFISRFSIYRLYKNLGICYQSDTSSKQSITHAPRHIMAELINLEDKENLYASDFLRHKSKSTLKFYK